jgi:hypothetical protein
VAVDDIMAINRDEVIYPKFLYLYLCSNSLPHLLYADSLNADNEDIAQPAGIYVVSGTRMMTVLLKAVGVIIGLTGIGLLIGALLVTVNGGVSLVTSSGYLLVVFVSALALLMACGGLSLAFHRTSTSSLVPPLALASAGGLMFIAIAGILAIGVREGKYPNIAGILILGALSLGWLRSGVRGLFTNKPFESTQ